MRNMQAFAIKGAVAATPASRAAFTANLVAQPKTAQPLVRTGGNKKTTVAIRDHRQMKGVGASFGAGGRLVIGDVFSHPTRHFPKNLSQSQTLRSGDRR